MSPRAPHASGDDRFMRSLERRRAMLGPDLELHHQQIIHFLEKNQIENTCNVIKENWMQILKHIK